MSVRCLAHRPAVVDHLATRGIVENAGPALAILVEIASTAELAKVRADHPGAAILALAPNAATEIALLDAGAEDVVLSTTPDAVIAARVAALLARLPRATTLRLGDLVIDRVTRGAARAGRALGLLPREYALLLHLVRHAGATLTRADLLAAVWGLNFDPGTNAIEVHISRLRAKLDRGFDAAMLVTEKGRGYRLVPPVEATPLAV